LELHGRPWGARRRGEREGEGERERGARLGVAWRATRGCHGEVLWSCSLLVAAVRVLYVKNKQEGEKEKREKKKKGKGKKEKGKNRKKNSNLEISRIIKDNL
jgi:hypothetical protein